MFVLVYVDDIIVASSNEQATSTLLRVLKEQFALKDLGELHYFLGIEVHKRNGGILHHYALVRSYLYTKELL